MNAQKVYFGMIGTLAILSGLVIGVLVIGNSMIESKGSELVELKLESHLLEEQQVALTQANRDIEEYEELENISKAIVPQDKDQARTVREIVKIAEESGVSFSNITFPTSNLGAAKPQARTNDSEDSEPSGTPTLSTPPVSQVEPVSGIPGVFEMSITIQSDSTRPISYTNLMNFLSRLEQNRRTAQVASINITPSNNNVNFVININVFIKP
jgi:hypothetical protein